MPLHRVGAADVREIGLHSIGILCHPLHPVRVALAHPLTESKILPSKILPVSSYQNPV